MRKMFIFATILMVVVAMFGFGVRTASAMSDSKIHTPTTLPPILVLESPYFVGLEPGQQVHAQMYVNSHFQNIYCIALNSTGEVQCQFPKNYANHSAILHIEAGDQTLLFWVTIPKEREVEFHPIA